MKHTYTIEAEEAEELKPYIDGLNLQCQVWGFQEWLRSYVKHDGFRNHRTKQAVAEHIEMMFHEHVEVD